MKIAMSWSGGKDSSLALHRMISDERYDVLGLLTTFTREYDRVTMHGVRRKLIRKQADAIGLPLYEVFIPANASNEVYDRVMEDIMKKLIDRGSEAIVFGDIFLEDVRRYREENLKKVGVKGIFPLWGSDTLELAKYFIDRGFKALVISVDSNVLGRGYVGKSFNYEFLRELPKNVDPCGENGEFHTFVYNGPIFKNEVEFVKGKIVLREGFYYQDLIPIQ